MHSPSCAFDTPVQLPNHQTRSSCACSALRVAAPVHQLVVAWRGPGWKEPELAGQQVSQLELLQAAAQAQPAASPGGAPAAPALGHPAASALVPMSTTAPPNLPSRLLV